MKMGKRFRDVKSFKAIQYFHASISNLQFLTQSIKGVFQNLQINI